jgi:hypothetical protein
MPPLKTATAAASASKTSFIKIPRLDTACSYRQWLTNLLKEKHNRKVLSQSEKDLADQRFRLQATLQFKLDNASLKRAMAEVMIDLYFASPR